MALLPKRIHLLHGLGVALGKGEMGDSPKFHLKIKPHPKNFEDSIERPQYIYIYTN